MTTAVKTLKKRNLTEGPILGKMLVFILPLIATNLLQAMYSAADMMIVGLSSEPDALGAVGTTNTFIVLINNIFIGFATGANVIVAKYLGAMDDKNASRATHTAVLVSILFGFTCGGLGIIISRPILSAMGASGKFLELGVSYTYIYLAGTPFIALTNYLIAIFRAKGDTRTPLFVLSLSGVINVLLNLFFVLIVGLSVEGVAIATVVSNVLSSIVLLFVLKKDDSPCKFSFKKLKIDKLSFYQIIHIGIPAAIQGALFSISNIIIQSSVLKVNNMTAPNAEFQPVVKGHAAAGNLEAFIYTTQNAVYQAIITFTSQNVGAKKPERLSKILTSAYTLSLLTVAFFGGLIILFFPALLSLYGVTPGLDGSLNRIAYDTAFKRLTYQMLPYFTLGFMEIGSGFLRGMGKSVTSTVISLIGACLLRIIWVMTIFNAYPTMEILYISYPVSWSLTAIAHFVLGSISRKKLIKINAEKTLIQESTAV